MSMQFDTQLDTQFESDESNSKVRESVQSDKIKSDKIKAEPISNVEFNTLKQSGESIYARYLALNEKQPGLRARNAAEVMGISEAELVASRVGIDAIRLEESVASILESVESLGSVMALTRNQNAVHERHGVYANAKFYSHGKMSMGLLVNEDIDLRLFLHKWRYSFAVADKTANSSRLSLQFFDDSGSAVHKIYITNESSLDAYHALTEQHASRLQLRTIDVTEKTPKAVDKPNHEIDWLGLRESWEGLKDTHDFFPMLRKYKVGRLQAFRGIGQDFAYEVNTDAPRHVLALARDFQCQIMVFVGNEGCIQIHTGRVNKLMPYGDWYNVLDQEFNLHLNESGIACCWITRKPTADGTVTALEVFDDAGEIIMTLFGKRRPGSPELDLWQSILEHVEPKQKHSAETGILADQFRMDDYI